MSGFPSRFNRGHLGPKFRNANPVENPETQIGDAQFNAAFWQTAGMNLIVPRVTLIARYVGAAFVIDAQEEAWNPDGAQAKPALVHTGVGVYTYTFAATYLDENGQAVPTVMRAPRISCHKVLTAFADRISAHVFIDSGNPLMLQIRLWLAASGAAVDEPFWLEAY